MASKPLIEIGECGLFCPAGNFHIDPWKPVDRAVVTHGHSDHARPGSKTYLAAEPGLPILRTRLGPDADMKGVPYAQTIQLDRASVSFHPAGHLLGSAQVRVEVDGEVWVVSGDYKIEADPTCAAFEPIPCHTFISECTFGLPIFRWPPQSEVFEEINRWWRANREDGRTSVIYAYALGKAQRVLAGVDASIGPILVHGAVERLNDAYQEAGAKLPATEHASPETAKATRGEALVVAPPSAAGSPWLRKFGKVSTAFASGWMRIRGTRRRRGVDRGFVLSDHADWDGLHHAIRATGAKRIGLMHGYTRVMSRWLIENDLNTEVLEIE